MGTTVYWANYYYLRVSMGCCVVLIHHNCMLAGSSMEMYVLVVGGVFTLIILC